jgi:hypothetical protein
MGKLGLASTLSLPFFGRLIGGGGGGGIEFSFVPSGLGREIEWTTSLKLQIDFLIFPQGRFEDEPTLGFVAEPTSRFPEGTAERQSRPAGRQLSLRRVLRYSA